MPATRWGRLSYPDLSCNFSVIEENFSPMSEDFRGTESMTRPLELAVPRWKAISSVRGIRVR